MARGGVTSLSARCEENRISETLQESGTPRTGHLKSGRFQSRLGAARRGVQGQGPACPGHALWNRGPARSPAALFLRRAPDWTHLIGPEAGTRPKLGQSESLCWDCGGRERVHWEAPSWPFVSSQRRESVFPAKRQLTGGASVKACITSHSGAVRLAPRIRVRCLGYPVQILLSPEGGRPTCPGSRASASGGGLLGQTGGGG